MYIPTVAQLRHAIEKGWRGKMPLQQWIVSYVCFWDTMICGARPKVDMGKIKLSTHHEGSYSQGWQRTAFKGGRAKLTGMKKGMRPWSMWRVSESMMSTHDCFYSFLMPVQGQRQAHSPTKGRVEPFR